MGRPRLATKSLTHKGGTPLSQFDSKGSPPCESDEVATVMLLAETKELFLPVVRRPPNPKHNLGLF